MVALSKIVARIQRCPDYVKEITIKFVNSRNPQLAQRAQELLFLCEDFNTLQDLYPVDSSCNEFPLEDGLANLAEWVAQQVENTSSPPSLLCSGSSYLP